MKIAYIVIGSGLLLGGYIYLKSKPSFIDNFDGTSLNSSTWTIRTWPDCDSAKTTCNNYIIENVAVNNGMLELRVAAAKTGGAIRSTSLYGYGTYETRLKFASENTDIGSDFWLNTKEDLVYESIDIEYWKYYPDRLLLSIYSGYDANHSPVKLVAHELFFGYDLSKDFHTFKIQKFPGKVAWHMDGTKIYEYIGSNTPSHGQGIKLDCYNPYWRPNNTTSGVMLIDYIKFTPHDWLTSMIL